MLNYIVTMEGGKPNGSAVVAEKETEAVMSDREIIVPTNVELGSDGTDGAEVTVAQNGKRFKLLSPANTYAAKKTVAQGMMDIALITANANQLRYVLDFGERDSIFYTITVLIVISLLLQVAVGVCLIFKGRFDMAGDSKHQYANRLNNYVVMGVFLVTIINVFIATFTISPKKNLTAS
ncbi:ninjurin-1-like isoform X2 [Periplaneta americana]|uniref:ninjurin-1-like isoform X2 n=1 Tax=Periplaneta americana TaxID=6978 RepID=UPI0037E70269